MSRYSRARFQPRADWIDEDRPLIPEINVDEVVTVDTGLVWADGSTIWRSPNPVGFGRDEDW